jgi:hypothetical protein
VESTISPESKGQGGMQGQYVSARPRYHQRVYLGLLIFVVVVGLPIVGAPSVRHRLKARVQTLRAAVLGQQIAPAPAVAKVGETREPFPQEYQHPRARPSDLADFEASLLRKALQVGDQGVKTFAIPPRPARRSAGGAPTAPAKEKAEPQPSAPPSAGPPIPGQPATDAGAEPLYRKGQSEQEAYDLLVSSNQTIAGMIKGGDPTLKFQDWAAANMGENSYYVMVIFVQTADNVARKYIWNVKLTTKEVVPLSAYAMSISK